MTGPSSAGSPHRRLLRSAGTTEDLFVNKGNWLAGQKHNRDRMTWTVTKCSWTGSRCAYTLVLIQVAAGYVWELSTTHHCSSNPNNKIALQEASHNLRITAFQSKNNSWLKWVNQLNGQTRNRIFWRRIKNVKGTPTRMDIYPNPENKANELIDSFAQRTLVTNN